MESTTLEHFFKVKKEKETNNLVDDKILRNVCLGNVFERLRNSGKYAKSVNGVKLFRGKDENGTELELEIITTLESEGFKRIELSELQTTENKLNNIIKNGNIDTIKKMFELNGFDNVFITIDRFPPDFIVYFNSEVYLVEAKSTGQNSVNYGDNLPKPNFIYVVKDRKNYVQTFYFGEDILSSEVRKSAYELKESFDVAVKELLSEWNDKLDDIVDGNTKLSEITNFTLRKGFGTWKGGKKTHPPLSKLKQQREQNIIDMVSNKL